MEQQGGQGGVVCGKCGASFETQEELDRHVESEHGEAEGSQQR
jgi:uncharacterized C2H2 Zn-finger protein